MTSDETRRSTEAWSTTAHWSQPSRRYETPEYFMGKHQDYWINLENENKQLKEDLEMERKGFADALAALKGEKK